MHGWLGAGKLDRVSLNLVGKHVFFYKQVISEVASLTGALGSVFCRHVGKCTQICEWIHEINRCLEHHS